MDLEDKKTRNKIKRNILIDLTLDFKFVEIIPVNYIEDERKYILCFLEAMGGPNGNKKMADIFSSKNGSGESTIHKIFKKYPIGKIVHQHMKEYRRAFVVTNKQDEFKKFYRQGMDKNDFPTIIYRDQGFITGRKLAPSELCTADEAEKIKTELVGEIGKLLD